MKSTQLVHEPVTAATRPQQYNAAVVQTLPTSESLSLRLQMHCLSWCWACSPSAIHSNILAHTQALLLQHVGYLTSDRARRTLLSVLSNLLRYSRRVPHAGRLCLSLHPHRGSVCNFVVLHHFQDVVRRTRASGKLRGER